MDRCPRTRVWLFLGMLMVSLAVAPLPARVSRAQTPQPSPGSIATFAGGGAGDGGPATSAALGAYGVVVSSTGDLFVADYAHCRIRKVSTGTITTVAGTGICTYGGDGGPAVDASLNRPSDIAVDSADNLYLPDSVTCRVRKISNGTIDTVVGNGTCGATGDGGPALSAGLSEPLRVAVASGNLYVVDSCNLREVSGGTINTIAGNGMCAYSGDNGPAINASLDFPAGVTVDPAGNVYNVENCRVRRIQAGIITTVAGTGACNRWGDGGPATAAMLDTPTSVAIDAAGDLYIGDNCAVRRVSGGIITTVAGNGLCTYSGDGGAAIAAGFLLPRGLAFDASGVMYIADYGDCRLRQVSGGIMTTIAGNGSCTFADASPPTNGSLSMPLSVAFDAAGSMYIADEENCRVRKVSANAITTIAGNGSCTDGGGDGGSATSAGVPYPLGVAVDGGGAVYVTDGLCRVRKVSAGVITTVAGNGQCEYDSGDGGWAILATLFHPWHLAIDGRGDLFIEDMNCRVRRVSGIIITTVAGNGTCISSGDGGPATSAGIVAFSTLAIGPDGDLYLAGDCSIRRISGGIITTVSGGPCVFDSPGHLHDGLFNLVGLAFDAAGNLYSGTGEYKVFDSAGHVTYTSPGCNILKLNGRVWSKIAGNGVCSYPWIAGATGDGGPATAAGLSDIGGLAVDASGNLYASDHSNDRVRRIYGVGDTVPNDDGDGILAYADNCPAVYNPDQTNSDGNNTALGRPGQDALGDACDPNMSGDGYTNEQHTALGKDPTKYCSVMRADVNADGVVNILDLAAIAAHYGETFTPTPPTVGIDTGVARLSQNADNTINILDLAAAAGNYNQKVTDCP